MFVCSCVCVRVCEMAKEEQMPVVGASLRRDVAETGEGGGLGKGVCRPRWPTPVLLIFVPRGRRGSSCQALVSLTAPRAELGAMATAVCVRGRGS